jgi:hypothetical protein
MRDIAHVDSRVNGESPEKRPSTVEEYTPPQGRQLWGASEIGRVIRRSARQTHHLLQRGAIKSAKKFGGRWTASEVALRREFGDETA